MLPDTALIFDFETIPDIALYKTILLKQRLKTCSFELAKELFEEEYKDKFPPIVYHHIVCVGMTFIHFKKNLMVHKVIEGEEKSIQTLVDLVSQYKPTLVTWNGYNFDLPLLQYKMMQHQICCVPLMDRGETSKDNKWNHYRSRYHDRHLDLCDVMANYTSAKVSLDDMSLFLGLPGKMGIGATSVWQAFQEKRISEISDYCLLDVINTTLIYFRYLSISQHMEDDYREELIQQYLDSLIKLNNPLVNDYLERLG